MKSATYTLNQTAILLFWDETNLTSSNIKPMDRLQRGQATPKRKAPNKTVSKDKNKGQRKDVGPFLGNESFRWRHSLFEMAREQTSDASGKLQRQDANTVPQEDPQGRAFQAEMEQVEAEMNQLAENPQIETPPNNVAQQIIENYNNSENQTPGGLCYDVCKSRLLQAYQDVMGHSLYDDLPADMATQYFSPRRVFNSIFNSASGEFVGWTTIDEEYRGKGAAGAVAMAGMGELKNEEQIWNGELEPGAVLQVWASQEGYEKVVAGVPSDESSPLGHSLIFRSYVRDENENITGMNVADQGYQSADILTQDSWAVWWGANVTVEAPNQENDTENGNDE